MSKVVSICGSATFYDEILEIAEKLRQVGCTVHTPKNEKKTLMNLSRDEFVTHKAALIKRQFDNIKNSDLVVIANYEKRDIKNYIGANTFLEMAVAFHESVPMMILNPLPDQDNIDELVAMQPEIIDGDIGKILEAIA